MLSVLLIISESISQIAFISTSLRSKHKLVIHCPLKPVPITPNLKFGNFLIEALILDDINANEALAKVDCLIKFLRFIFL